MSRYAHASKADLACDQFRRDMLDARAQAVAPTTWRLMRAVNDAMAGLSFRHPMHARLDELLTRLSGDAEHGIESDAKTVAEVDGLLAQIKVTA